MTDKEKQIQRCERVNSDYEWVNYDNNQPHNDGSRYILPIIVSLATTIIFNYIADLL